MIHLNDAIKWAKENKTAIPAFNAFSLDFMAYVGEFSKMTNWPIIIQTSTKTVEYYSVRMVMAMFNSIKAHYGSPIFIHLDHCSNIHLIRSCIHSGYNSIMADFSSHSIAVNIRELNLIAKVASKTGCLVEGEVGKLGKEDGQGSDSKCHTLLEDAINFTSRANVDLFAPVFGNAHGNYKFITPFLDFDLLKKIALTIKVPLVLHGTSGLTPTQIKQCIRLGTIKINFSTVFKNVFNELIINNQVLPFESKEPLIFNINIKKKLFKEFEAIYGILNTNQTTIG